MESGVSTVCGIHANENLMNFEIKLSWTFSQRSCLIDGNRFVKHRLICHTVCCGLIKSWWHCVMLVYSIDERQIRLRNTFQNISFESFMQKFQYRFLNERKKGRASERQRERDGQPTAITPICNNVFDHCLCERNECRKRCEVSGKSNSSTETDSIAIITIYSSSISISRLSFTCPLCIYVCEWAHRYSMNCKNIRLCWLCVCAREIVKRNELRLKELQIKFIIDEIHERSHSGRCVRELVRARGACHLTDLNGVILRTHLKQWSRDSIAKSIDSSTSERKIQTDTEQVSEPQ